MPWGEWGVVLTTCGAVASLLVAAISAFGAVQSSRAAKRSANAAERSAMAAEATLLSGARPVLVFARRLTPRGRMWQLVNAGKGCAISIVLGDHEGGDAWRTTRLYPLLPGERITVQEGLHSGNKVAAVYSDICGRTFTTECGSNHNQVSVGNLYPNWKISGEEQDWKSGPVGA